MDRLVDRVIDGTQLADVVAMATLLYGLPKPVDQADAIAVFPGLGENWRLIDGVRAWDDSKKARNLFITGIFRGEKTRVQPTVEYLSGDPFSMKRSEGVVIQDHAHHTKEQAEWLVEQIQSKKVQSVALFVSPYHLLRAYCTLLKAFMKSGHPLIPIIPMPVAVSPSALIPEVGVDAWKMAHGEVERIIKYQELGDVATVDELKGYLKWLCEQPIMNPLLKG